MKNVEILENMLKLQQKLNDETNGLNWEEGYTKEGKLISWRRCIYMECAELIDFLLGNIGKIFQALLIGKMFVWKS